MLNRNMNTAFFLGLVVWLAVFGHFGRGVLNNNNSAGTNRTSVTQLNLSEKSFSDFSSENQKSAGSLQESLGIR